jgi:hypothetical protein
VRTPRPGAAGRDPKGPSGKPDAGERDGDRYAARPPSERPKQAEAPRGVGVFRLTGWGWGFTLAILGLVGLVVLVGYLRDDPGRNPAPSAYRTAVCAAFTELRAGTRALERGVADDDPTAHAAAAREVEDHVAAANEALRDLPVWEPGRSLDELLGSQIITLTNGAAALRDGSGDTDLEIAREVDASGAEQLADGRYGFACAVGSS